MTEKRPPKQIISKPKPKLRSSVVKTISTIDSCDDTYNNNNSTPDFLFSSTKSLNDLRKSRLFTDIDIECTGTGKIYSAHSVVLASSSGFFRTYFTMKFQETDSKLQPKRSKSCVFGKEIIPIRRKMSLEIKPQILATLLEFMYTGNLILPLDANELKIIVISAHKLKIPKFVSYFVDSLRSRLSISTHSLLWDVAVDLDHRELREEVVRFLAKQFDQVTESGEIISMPVSRLKAICQYLQNNADSHDEILNAILLWVKHDLLLRESELPTLLRYVNTTSLSSIYISVLVKNEPLIRRADRFWDVLSATHVERIQQNKKIIYPLPISTKHKSFADNLQLSFLLSKELASKSELCRTGSTVRVYSTPKRSTASATNAARLCNQQQQKQLLSEDDALSPRSRQFISKNKRLLFESTSASDLQSEAMGDGEKNINDKKINNNIDVKRRASITLPMSQSRKTKYNAGTMAILGRSRNGNTLMQFLCLERKIWHVPEDPCEMFTALDYILPRKAACAVCGFLFFLLGGLLGDGRAVNTTVVYDYQSSLFTKRNNMKYARYNSGAIILDGYLYVIGGLNEKTLLSKVERNLIFVDKWEDLAPIPMAGEQILSAVVDKQIFCVSICRDSLEQVRCFYYTPKYDQWTMIKFMTQEMINGSQFLITSYQGFLYAILWKSLQMTPMLTAIYYYNNDLKDWKQIRFSGSSPERDMVAVLSTRNTLWIVDIEGILYKFNVRKRHWEDYHPSLPVLTTPLYAGIVNSIDH